MRSHLLWMRKVSRGTTKSQLAHYYKECFRILADHWNKFSDEQFTQNLGQFHILKIYGFLGFYCST